jgi:hypothetical protein
MKIETGALSGVRVGAFPAVIVIAAKDRDLGLITDVVQESFRRSTSGEGVEGVTEPEEFAGLIVGEQCAELAGDLGVAP